MYRQPMSMEQDLYSEQTVRDKTSCTGPLNLKICDLHHADFFQVQRIKTNNKPKCVIEFKHSIHHHIQMVDPKKKNI